MDIFVHIKLIVTVYTCKLYENGIFERKLFRPEDRKSYVKWILFKRSFNCGKKKAESTIPIPGTCVEWDCSIYADVIDGQYKGGKLASNGK